MVYLKIGRRNKLEDSMLELAIVQNPHVKDPKSLINELRRSHMGLQDEQKEEFLDKDSLKRLKSQVQIDKLKRKK